jgi:hypothetical protein
MSRKDVPVKPIIVPRRGKSLPMLVIRVRTEIIVKGLKILLFTDVIRRGGTNILENRL